MLAPRKTLWSTPDGVLSTLISWIQLRPNDVVCDIGCGDGRVLIDWASRQTLSVAFIGLEICPQRAQQAENNVKKAYASGIIPSHVQVSIHCANAMDALHLYRIATVFFLYLIPRGLRLMKPILLKVAREQKLTAQRGEPLRVVTYMSPLPEETCIAKELCCVDHQPGAAWPLYLYHLYAEEHTSDGVEQSYDSKQHIQLYSA
jgi:SAM-dependent methyltransferase